MSRSWIIDVTPEIITHAARTVPSDRAPITVPREGITMAGSDVEEFWHPAVLAMREGNEPLAAVKARMAKAARAAVLARGRDQSAADVVVRGHEGQVLHGDGGSRLVVDHRGHLTQKASTR